MPRLRGSSTAPNLFWGRTSPPLRIALQPIATLITAARSIAGPRRCILRCSRPDIGPGDEVITVSMTFVATTAAILYSGAKPVFVDVDPVTWTMNPALIEAAITPRTKAILPVHLHGLMADMDPIMEIARRHGSSSSRTRRRRMVRNTRAVAPDPSAISVASASIPARTWVHTARAGRWSPISPTSHDEFRCSVIGARNPNTITLCRATIIRMDGIQGAVLNVKMDYLESWTEGRRTVASYYDHLLEKLRSERPRPPTHSRHVYHVYAVRLARRDEALKALQEGGIGVGIHYPVPVHLQKAYANLGYRAGDFPVTERLANEFLSLPIYPELRPDQVAEVVSELEKAVLV